MALRAGGNQAITNAPLTCRGQIDQGKFVNRRTKRKLGHSTDKIFDTAIICRLVEVSTNGKLSTEGGQTMAAGDCEAEVRAIGITSKSVLKDCSLLVSNQG